MSLNLHLRNKLLNRSQKRCLVPDCVGDIHERVDTAIVHCLLPDRMNQFLSTSKARHQVKPNFQIIHDQRESVGIDLAWTHESPRGPTGCYQCSPQGPWCQCSVGKNRVDVSVGKNCVNFLWGKNCVLWGQNCVDVLWGKIASMFCGEKDYNSNGWF